MSSQIDRNIFNLNLWWTDGVQFSKEAKTIKQTRHGGSENRKHFEFILICFTYEQSVNCLEIAVEFHHTIKKFNSLVLARPWKLLVLEVLDSY